MLDGLRGCAALSVVALHIIATYPFIAPPPRAYLAVDFFFMLSGFVIAFAYEAKLANGMSFARFSAVRLVRLYPMVFFGVTLGIVSRLTDGAAGFGIGSVLAAAVFAYMMLPLPRVGDRTVSAFPINGPLWSLTFELLANLLYGATARLLTTRRLAVATIALVLMLIGLALGHGGVDIGVAWNWMLPLGLIRVLSPFAIGILIFRRTTSRPIRVPLSPLLAVALLLALLWAPVPQTTAPLYDVAAILIGFPAVLAIGLAGDPHRHARLWQWLGAISYPVYAINQPVLFIMRAALATIGIKPNSPDMAAALGTILLAILVAEIARRWFDEPLRAYLRRVWLRGSPSRIIIPA